MTEAGPAATSEPVRFAIVGAGWRSGFFLRVAAALPERFRVTGVTTRDTGRAAAVGAEFGVPTYASLDEALRDRPAFVVASVPRQATPGLIRELAGRRIPVLAETPPAPDVAGLRGLADLARTGAPIQVAEQYRFQPLHAARLAAVEAGLLGAVSEAQVSVAHDYHGIDLIRRTLGVGYASARIVARRFTSTIVAGPDRDGPPTDERVAASLQTLAWLEFGGTLGVYDFTDDQYFSWIRTTRVLIRGERGEIADTTLRRLLDARTPVETELVRRDAGSGGNLEGFHHVGYTLGDDWLYRNPVAPARLADDEIAVATCLLRMSEYVEGGPGFCSLAEGAWDQELALAVAEAADTGREVRADGSFWGAAAGR